MINLDRNVGFSFLGGWKYSEMDFAAIKMACNPM